MTNKYNNKNASLLKSLLVIIALQLVVLQVQAISMPFNINQHKCNHSLIKGEMVSHSGDQLSSVACEDCDDFNLNCFNSCNSPSIYSLTYNAEINLENLHSFYYLENNKSLFAVSQQPNLRPPK